MINNIIHGDCLGVMKDIPDGSIDMVLTSPPYDKLRSYNNSLVWGQEIWEATIRELHRVVKTGGVVVWVVGDETVKGSETGTSFKQALYAKEIGFNLWDTMIYEKSGMSYPGSPKRYYNTFEYMFILTKGYPATSNMIKDRKNKYVGTQGGNHRGGLCTRGEFGRRFNVWRYNNGKHNSSKDAKAFQHPAIFPEQLAIDHITSWSNPGDLILDPFAGSGTTGIAAKNLNRQFILIEKEKEYYDICLERLKL